MRTWRVAGRFGEVALGFVVAVLLTVFANALTSVHPVPVILPLVLFLCGWPASLQIGSDGFTVSRFGRRRYVSFAEVTGIRGAGKNVYVSDTRGSVVLLSAFHDELGGEIADALRTTLDAWRTREAPTRLLAEDGGDPFRGGGDPVDAREILNNPRYPARVRVTAARIVAREPEGAGSLRVTLEETADPEMEAEISALLRPRE